MRKVYEGGAVFDFNYIKAVECKNKDMSSFCSQCGKCGRVFKNGWMIDANSTHPDWRGK